MPGSVHHSAVQLRKSSRLVATIAIHMADLIAAQERWLSSGMLENRSCSRSSYLGDGCWQPTQAPCTFSRLFSLLHLIFYFLLCPSHAPPLFVYSALSTLIPPVPAPWCALCSISCLQTAFLCLWFTSHFLPIPFLPCPGSLRLTGPVPHPLSVFSTLPPFIASFASLFAPSVLIQSPHLSALFITSPLLFRPHPLPSHFFFYRSLHRLLRPGSHNHT